MSKLIFSIDNHNLTIIAADFVPVEPVPVQSIPIGIGTHPSSTCREVPRLIVTGQRYTVIAKAVPDDNFPPVLDGNYWIRASTIQTPGNDADFCGKMSPGQPGEGLGIIRYDNKSTDLPSSFPQYLNTTDCSQEIFEALQPKVRCRRRHRHYHPHFWSKAYGRSIPPRPMTGRKILFMPE
jgi:hypothetical protein